MNAALRDAEALLTRTGAPKPVRDGLLHAHDRLQSMHRASLHALARAAAQEYVRWAFLLVEWGVTRRGVDATQPLPPDWEQRLRRLPETKTFHRADLDRMGRVLGSLLDLARPREGPVAPDAMDSDYLAHASAWATAELVRMLGEAEPALARDTMDRLMVVRPALRWDEHGQAMLQIQGLKLLDRVLAVLYFHPHASLEEVQKFLPEAAAIAVTGAATQNPDLVFYSKRAGTLEITGGGREHVERNVLPRARGGGGGGQGRGRRR